MYPSVSLFSSLDWETYDSNDICPNTNTNSLSLHSTINDTLVIFIDVNISKLNTNDANDQITNLIIDQITLDINNTSDDFCSNFTVKLSLITLDMNLNESKIDQNFSLQSLTNYNSDIFTVILDRYLFSFCTFDEIYLFTSNAILNSEQTSDELFLLPLPSNSDILSIVIFIEYEGNSMLSFEYESCVSKTTIADSDVISISMIGSYIKEIRTIDDLLLQYSIMMNNSYLNIFPTFSLQLIYPQMPNISSFVCILNVYECYLLLNSINNRRYSCSPHSI